MLTCVFSAKNQHFAVFFIQRSLFQKSKDILA